MNENLAGSIRLDQLSVARQIQAAGSFSKAAENLDVSQSSLSRKIREMEVALGFEIFQRTTRSLQLTRAGAILLQETEAVHGILDGAMKKVREQCFGEREVIRVGVSRSLSLAHLPGLFSTRHCCRDSRLILSHPRGPAVVKAVRAAALDIGITTIPPHVPGDLRILRQFADEMVLIANSTPDAAVSSKARFGKWSGAQSWLLPFEGSVTRQVLQRWFGMRGVEIEPTMELDSFDVILQLVELGMGVAFVPRRTLSAFRRQKNISRIELKDPPVRELGVFVRKEPEPGEKVMAFVGQMLFS